MKKMDFHVHISNDQTDVQKSIEYFEALSERNHLDAICIQSAVMSSNGMHPDCNEKALEIIKNHNNWYAFASLHHERDFVEQTKEYMDKGFRGIKMLEGKPTVYRKYGYGFENPRFESFFDYAERNAIPLLIHNNDPLIHWDINKISERALRKGWYYDSSFPSQEYFFEVLEAVLKRHPNLHAALAHFGFYSDNIEKAEYFMELCPNLFMDMTPAMIIYDQLSRTPEKTKQFLMKYQNRLIYGTDVSNCVEGEVRKMNDAKTKLMHAFFEKSDEQDIESFHIQGMNLPYDHLRKLYYDNAINFINASAI